MTKVAKWLDVRTQVLVALILAVGGFSFNFIQTTAGNNSQIPEIEQKVAKNSEDIKENKNLIYKRTGENKKEIEQMYQRVQRVENNLILKDTLTQIKLNYIAKGMDEIIEKLHK